MLNESLKDFLIARNDFLSTFQSVEGVREFQRKWNGINERMERMADIVVMAGYHKARLGWLACPENLKAESRTWLAQHGFALDP